MPYFKFDHLALCAEENPDGELNDFVPEFRAMSLSLSALNRQIAGKVAFVDSRRLGFMRRAQKIRRIISFYSLIPAIDVACRNGVSQ